MKTAFIILTLFLFGCSAKTDTQGKSSDNQADSLTSETPKEIWGDRLQVTGNFDGDGQLDTLTEVLISSLDNQETNKYYEGIEYDSLVALTTRKKPLCRLTSSAKTMTDLELTSKTGQLFGLAFLKNEGDLDNNGTDEIGLVVDWADFSNVNSYRLYTYSDTGWTEMLSFEVRDFDFAKDETGKYIDTTFNGLLIRTNNGQFIAKTYDLGERTDKIVELTK